MKLYNSLTRQLEEFAPINPPHVGMYTCGPTVYDYPHIGNWRTFTLGDLVIRVLKTFGYEVNSVMNITDVGHLTGDNLGDASTGEDRLEKAAVREGKNAWDIAAFYTKDFVDGYKSLNLTMPKLNNIEGFCIATDHIQEQIQMVKQIEEKGFAYKISDGIYFDVGAYEKAGNSYGLMSNIHKDNVEARVEENKEKKDKRDFALWKFSPSDQKRQMEWESPWGMGFPGWHIECSAMSVKYLGEQFDIHVGGEDHKSTHHPNEIAQSEAATGKKPFVKYWLHGAFLTVDGGRMGKSLGNAYTLQDIQKRGFDLMDLRYLYLTGHYRKPLNFTWEALGGAKTARIKLSQMVSIYRSKSDRTVLSEAKLEKVNDYQKQFRDAIGEDLNMPQALAVAWEVVKSNIPDYDKYDLLVSFDEVLGLKLAQTSDVTLAQIPLPSGINLITSLPISDEVVDLVNQRNVAKQGGNFAGADQIRAKIADMGLDITDTPQGVHISKK